MVILMKELHQPLNDMGHWFEDLDLELFIEILALVTVDTEKEQKKEIEEQRDYWKQQFSNIPTQQPKRWEL